MCCSRDVSRSVIPNAGELNQYFIQSGSQYDLIQINSENLTKQGRCVVSISTRRLDPRVDSLQSF